MNREDIIKKMAAAIKNIIQGQQICKENHPDNPDWIGGKDGVQI